MKKIMMVFGMIASLLLGMNTVAFAEETPTATFDGSSEIKYNYDDTTNFGTAFEGMMPGEERTQEILLENTYSRTVNFYMQQEVIRAFEDTVDASGAAYDISLVLVKGSEEDVIFGGNEEGGTGRVGGDEEGLANLNDAMEGWIYLTALEPNETASLQMTVRLDGESNTNAYQSASGTFDFQFRATYDDPETVYEKGETQHVTKEVKGEDVVTKIVRTVKTGDNAPILILSAAGAAAVLLLIVLLVIRRRKEKEA